MKKVVYQEIFHHVYNRNGFALHINMEECEKNTIRSRRKGQVEFGKTCLISVPEEWYNKLVSDLSVRRVAFTFLTRIKPKKVHGYLLKMIKRDLKSAISVIERERA